jgi:ABC-type Fe3+/spermidine/putrescine transport system ATPase subunit
MTTLKAAAAPGAGAAGPMLVLRDVRKSYGRHEVIKGVSLTVHRGELVTVVGPSGCGKTTLLRMIGGFTDASSGDIILDGQRVNDLPPNLRDTRICFQNYALFPHMTVAGNIAYALRIHGWSRAAIAKRVEELLEMVELRGYGDRMVDKLSGGQQQRVAFARALSLEPKVLLLDEPLSNLDANLRLVMREEIRRLQGRLGITTVLVTHDQFEAMAISDRLAVMRDGLVEQVGTPIEIYERPATEFVAGFVGHVNFLPGRLRAADAARRAAVVETALGEIEVALEQPGLDVGDDVVIVIRPESIGLSIDAVPGRPNVLAGTLEMYTYAGALAKCSVAIGGHTLIVDQYNPRDARHFKDARRVAVEIPRSVHLLKRRGALVLG